MLARVLQTVSPISPLPAGESNPLDLSDWSFLSLRFLDLMAYH